MKAFSSLVGGHLSKPHQLCLLALGILGIGLIAFASHVSAASGTQPESQVASSALNIRENPSEYTVDLTLPERELAGLIVRMQGKTLHISSGQSTTGVTQEQRVSLPGAQEGVPPSLRQDGGHVVITVAKSGAQGAGAGQTPQIQISGSQNPAASRPDNFSAIRDQMLAQFAQMRQQMDQMMNTDAGSQSDPFDQLFSQGAVTSGLSSSMGLFQMKEEKDKYILSARLPEEQAKNIKVAVDNDRILKITSEATNSSAAAGFGSYSSSNFSQSLSLPGPVKTEKISMDYKDGCFEIDLPKA